MLRRALVVIVTLGIAAGSAGAGAQPVEVPPGWTLDPAATARMLAHMKRLRLAVDGGVYVAPGGDARMVWSAWSVRIGVEVEQVLVLNSAAVHSEIGKGRHVSDERHFDGDQLVSHAVDVDPHGVTFVYARRYALDSEGATHALEILCTGSEQARAPCTAEQDAMRLSVPDEVDWSHPLRLVWELVGITSGLGLLVGLGTLVWSRRRRARPTPARGS